ncbi:MAG TPA: HNH endonuclease signature motif containing protein [Terriglobales bacterium]|nr:HNH endonuclease signature motif containing protein [Terriglobales bacterium]
MGSKQKIREFLLANIGRVVSSKDIRDAVGPNVSEWARRVRELREDEGWPIRTHHDDAKLKPGQYVLTEKPKIGGIVFSRVISAKLRALVFDRNGFTCQMCGLTPGEIDPATGRKVRLHVGHIVDKSHGGKDELENLRTLCSTCNQGAKNITTEKPRAIWLLSQVRRAGIAEQREVFEWLAKKFSKQ